jgi:hypothetical protein
MSVFYERKIMIEQIPAGVEDIYQDIAQQLVNILPENFVETWASFDVNDEGTWSSEVFFKKPNGRIELSEEDLDDVDDAFLKLYQAYKAESAQVWTSATFFLTNDGDMNLDFGYDDVSDFEQAEKRRDMWIKKYLKDSSLIDWPAPPDFS